MNLMPLAPGDKLGAYEIVAPIGAGGMGEVLPVSLARDADFLARFQREALPILVVRNRAAVVGA